MSYRKVVVPFQEAITPGQVAREPITTALVVLHTCSSPNLLACLARGTHPTRDLNIRAHPYPCQAVPPSDAGGFAY